MALFGSTAQFLLHVTVVAGPPLEAQVMLSPLVDTSLTVGTPKYSEISKLLYKSIVHIEYITEFETVDINQTKKTVNNLCLSSVAYKQFGC